MHILLEANKNIKIEKNIRKNIILKLTKLIKNGIAVINNKKKMTKKKMNH